MTTWKLLSFTNDCQSHLSKITYLYVRLKSDKISSEDGDKWGEPAVSFKHHFVPPGVCHFLLLSLGGSDEDKVAPEFHFCTIKR